MPNTEQDAFRDEQAAYRYVERHVWPDGPICPRCGEHRRVGPLRGASTHVGTYKCYACRKPFSVKLGTIMEFSNVPLYKWLQAIALISDPRNRISTAELHETLSLTYKTAAALRRRIETGMISHAFPLGVRPRNSGHAAESQLSLPLAPPDVRPLDPRQ